VGFTYLLGKTLALENYLTRTAPVTRDAQKIVSGDVHAKSLPKSAAKTSNYSAKSEKFNLLPHSLKKGQSGKARPRGDCYAEL